MNSLRIKLSFLFLLLFIAFCFTACNLPNTTEATSDTGISKVHLAPIQTDVNGMSVEQKNISDRLLRDNELGSIKHLYIISAYTGDVMQYSTVRSKVTSGNKRLTPKTVNGSIGVQTTLPYNFVTIGNHRMVTDEILDDGGAYGDSGNYLFWFDAQGNYHQYYPSGGTYLHISDRPMRIKKSNMSIELMEHSPTLPAEKDVIDLTPPKPTETKTLPVPSQK